MSMGDFDRVAIRDVLTDDHSIARRVLDAMPFYVLLVDGHHRIVMANEPLYATYGFTPDQVVGAYCPKCIHGSDGPFAGCPLEEAHRTGHDVERELYDPELDMWFSSGAYITDLKTDAGDPIYLHVVIDITERKKSDEALAKMRAELESTVAVRTAELSRTNGELREQIAEREHAEAIIRRLAFYDGLTGLPNRVDFSRRLAEGIESAQNSGRKFAVALLDVDGLKGVNDTLGHNAGDELLRHVGARLELAIRENDTAARMAGDEFLFILDGISDSSDFALIATRLLGAFDEPFGLCGNEVRVSASIGGAVYPDDATDEQALLRLADLAMYEAKRAGGGGFRRFDIHDLAEKSTHESGRQYV